MDEPSTLLDGQVVAGRYRIDSALGAGAMGSVHRGARLADGLPVAIKFLHGEALTRWDLRRRFEREARALAAVTHPNVIGVLEFGEMGDTLFLVMELLSGRTLESLLAAQRLAPEQALAFTDQVLAGLAFAHAHGVLHRDIKPDNVFIQQRPDGSSCAKLLDFGLAKFTDDQTWGPQTQLTTQGAIMGTPPYMAPEQIFGPRVDARTDVYAMGIVVYELLTGTWPFVAEELTELFRLHATAPVPPLGSLRPELEVHPELDALLQKALAKRPDDRFADAQEMRLALKKIPRPAARLA